MKTRYKLALRTVRLAWLYQHQARCALRGKKQWNSLWNNNMEFSCINPRINSELTSEYVKRKLTELQQFTTSVGDFVKSLSAINQIITIKKSRSSRKIQSWPCPNRPKRHISLILRIHWLSHARLFDEPRRKKKENLVDCDNDFSLLRIILPQPTGKALSFLIMSWVRTRKNWKI